MLKMLLTLAVVVIGLMMWFGKGRARTHTRGTPAPTPQRQPPAAPQAMLSCVRCGVHLPQSDAFLDDSGRAFCGAEHRRLGPASGPAR
jgi:uncharacterized protein